ncbi:hypothetical protein BX265_4996 [Streptomyces sp. TLI_235]|nr:hypothetical protein [Streptomyces sp. TLI_235]PBC80160.1 hypothetical protein BX265_4996 [Streptomyces sp. TLI_235]
MSIDQFDDRLAALGPAREITGDTAAAAEQYIRQHATDDQDAEILLDALLGPLTTEKGNDDPEHNAAAYGRGCRCDVCRAANTAYHRAQASGRITKYQRKPVAP